MATLDNDDILHNKYIPHNELYFLAEGDADPSIESVKFVLFPADEDHAKNGRIMMEQLKHLHETDGLPEISEIYPKRIYN